MPCNETVDIVNGFVALYAPDVQVERPQGNTVDRALPRRAVLAYHLRGRRFVNVPPIAMLTGGACRE